jgi:hypothetical protein
MINVVPQGVFGPGILVATRTDVSGVAPINVGYCNEFSTDLSFDTKELSGQNQLPLLVARGTGKFSGKIKAAAMSSAALNVILLGSMASTVVGTQYDLSTTVSTAIPATPFQITPAVPSSGTWNSDLGVINAATGAPLQPVASGPAAGQYAVASGQYTFSTADHTAGISVIISFSYSYTSAAGQVVTMTNQPIGTTPSFQLDYRSILYGATYYLRIMNCVGSKWGMAHKLNDFAMPEYDVSMFPNAAGILAFLSVASQA